MFSEIVSFYNAVNGAAHNLIAGNGAAEAILSVAVMLAAGFLTTRLTKLMRLPNVTGYILAGFLIGPGILGLVTQSTVDSMGFVTDAALALIAFGVGRYLTPDKLRGKGAKILLVALFEVTLTGTLATLFFKFVFGYSLPFAALLGAIASSTAPVSTTVMIRQYRAKGEFVDTALQCVACDDAISLLAFSVAASAASASLNGGDLSNNGAMVWLIPLLSNLALIGLGSLFGLLLAKKLIVPSRTGEHCLILAVSALLILAGIGALLDVSPLLSCMTCGGVYVCSGGKTKLFKRIDRFSPPLMLLYFVIAGAGLDIGALAAGGIAGISYFFIRMAFKYGSTTLAAVALKIPNPVRFCLGLTMIPQAGVSIGLAALGTRILGGENGRLLSAIVLSAAFLYEIAGPLAAKTALMRSGSVGGDNNCKSNSSDGENISTVEKASDKKAV